MDSTSKSLQHLSPSSTTRRNNTFRSSPRSSPPSVYVRSPPSPPARPEPLNLQTRRLQLRNARFQGARISPNKVVSDRFSTWRSTSPASDISVDKENRPASPDDAVDQRQQDNRTPGSTPASARRRVSILREIHDSSQRGRKLRRPSLSRLFGPPLDVSDHSVNQRYSYTSPSSFRRLSPYSIFRDNDADPLMTTQNQHNRSSPLSTLNTNRLRSNSRDRASNYATERYIEHLEEQLAAMQNQSSPMQESYTKTHVSKVRTLNAEIKVLRQEVAEWEDKFDIRVHEEVGRRTEIENKLRTRIIFLEGELEDYVARIRELEHERDLQAQKLRNVESLRSTNRSLERRIDVLTQLLAESPTKVEPRSPEVSPTRSPGPRLSRPKSMLPAMPLRQDITYQPLVDPSSVVTPEASVETHPEPEVPDLISDDSTVASSVLSQSKRSSTASHPSPISSQWSVPLPFSPELQGKTTGRPRNMRRFPSGTCTLKPLILPTTATPTPTSPHRPSTSGGPYSSIYSPGYERGATEVATGLVQEETLAALEGRTQHYQAYEDAMSELEDGDMSDSPLSRKSGPDVKRFSTTLYSELEEAERNDESTSQTSRLSTPVGSYRLNVRSSYSTPKAYNSVSLSMRKTSDVDLEAGTGVGQERKKSSFARTLIAGIWTKTAKQLSRLSWWVLGFLFGSEQRNEWMNAASSLRMRMKPETRRRSSQHVCDACGHGSQDVKRASGNPTNNNLDGINRTIVMWTKLSIAMIVAFGRAVRYGPETVLLEKLDNELKRSSRPSSVHQRPARNRSIETDSFGHHNKDELETPPKNTSDEYTTWPMKPLTVEDFFIT
ncbi:hypothetical protein TSTA_017540 [Talaromyces stipitatus ATCC 10500]|uniref:Uncharacterized protein n=1 Tax=Talaromyces stipitatus (strain ATCC 10500 / CBS 375.48 / QM 6759 / NRRL 1006) TaxID=441959 RepID=B8MFE5_TALSN|nr:uncharacterized protein TSTA_017540 [Talaromyces stipitatus ATCC 10500]EED16679.1 hypothetical protein TSTA_017540 [Talaromyces stipitatus ATCC 10500]